MAFKASIALTVTVPQAFLAVSNMPVVSEEPVGDGKKRVAFQRTVNMPPGRDTVNSARRSAAAPT
jgi:aminopeptidase N